jgi:hypothetical protein
MLVRNRNRNRRLSSAVFDPEIPQAGRIKQVWSSRFMESMRVKPVGTGNLDKLEFILVVRSAWVQSTLTDANPPATQNGNGT